MDLVEKPNVSTPHILHHRSDCADDARCHKQVDMIRHQHIRMNVAAMTRGGVLEASQVEATVAVGEETRGTVVSTLDYV
jgi:hypothetical protein